MRLGVRAGVVGAVWAVVVFLSMPAIMEFLGGGTVTMNELRRLVGVSTLDLWGYFLLGIVVLVISTLCMLTSRIGASAETNPALGRIGATVLGGGLFAILAAVAWRAPWMTSNAPNTENTAERIGDLFLGEYLLPFELTSLLLLATLVAAVVVARKEVAR
jgi:hypothetical protein